MIRITVVSAEPVTRLLCQRTLVSGTDNTELCGQVDREAEGYCCITNPRS